MNSRALARLAALTQGAALIGAGVLACSASSTATPTLADPSVSPSSATSSASTGASSDPAASAADAALVVDVAAPTLDASAVALTPATGAVDAGPGPVTTTDDAGHRRHFPTPNGPPRRRDAGLPTITP